MNNLKTISVTTEGSAKRMAITFDEVDESGKVVKSNIKTNRVVMDENALKAIATIEAYAQGIIDAE
mgnify:CR=1 FL=1